MKPGTALARGLSAVAALYILGTLVWAWAFQFRAELHKPLLLVYLSLFTAAFLVAGVFLLRWAWSSQDPDGDE